MLYSFLRANRYYLYRLVRVSLKAVRRYLLRRVYVFTYLLESCYGLGVDSYGYYLYVLFGSLLA